uniref:GTP-binding protein Rhes n=1 Tax=Eptatretus burgeri TaxID=7764 RepID=A0A8C4NEJ5_EPTBU
MHHQANTFALRLAFFGPAGAGKTALIRRYLRGSFEAQYESTVEDFYSLDRVPAELRVEILDSGGGHSFPAMRRLAMQRSDAVALVFSPHEQDSFEVLRWLRQELLEARTGESKLPFVVVANKSDTPLNDESMIIAQTAQDTAVSEWGSQFFETSALSGDKVAELFAALFRLGVPPATMEQGSQLPARRVQRTGSADEPRHKMPVSEHKRHSCVVS